MAGTKDGEWLIPGLSPGTVTVTATLEGMETATVEGVRVSISGVASVNLTMRPSISWNVDGLDGSFPDNGSIFGGWTDIDTIAEQPSKRRSR